MFFCEHYSSPDMVPSDAVVQWADNGAILCLRPQDPALTSEAAGWAQAGKLVSTTSFGIWHITPETYVKVVSWQKGAQLEGRTVKFINDKHPEIPTTRVIYEWIDPTWTRTFMIMKRARGVLMAEALVYMDDSQVKDVADQVAAHVKTLTQHNVKQDAIENQKGNFDRSQNKENQKCNSYSALQVFSIERIVERWCFLFLHLYPRNSLEVREPFGGVGDGKTNKEDQGEQVESIVP